MVARPLKQRALPYNSTARRIELEQIGHYFKDGRSTKPKQLR